MGFLYARDLLPQGFNICAVQIRTGGREVRTIVNRVSRAQKVTRREDLI